MTSQAVSNATLIVFLASALTVVGVSFYLGVVKGQRTPSSRMKWLLSTLTAVAFVSMLVGLYSSAQAISQEHLERARACEQHGGHVLDGHCIVGHEVKL